MRRGGRWIPFGVALVAGTAAIAMFTGGAGEPDGTIPPVTTVSTSPDTTAAFAAAAATSTTSMVTVEPASTTTTVVVDGNLDPYGGVASVGVVGFAETLNPFIARSGLGDAVGAVTWASAFVVDGDSYDLRPGVLAEIPSYENGGLVANADGSVTVTLRVDPDARWQDGQPITGSDLAFTAELLATDRRVDRDVRDLYRIITDPLASTRDYRFTVHEPTIDYFSLFEVILPRHQVEGSDFINDWRDRIWLSAGPFIAGSIQADGAVPLRRNPLYGGVDAAGSHLPFLDGLLLVPYDDPAGVLNGLTEKVLSVGDLKEDYRLIGEREDLLVSVAQGEEWEHVGFQFGPGRFAANPRSMVSSKAFRDLVSVVVGDDDLVAEIGGSGLYPIESVVGASWPAAATDGRETVEEPSLELVAAELERDFVEQPPRVVYATTVALDRSQMAGIVLRELAARGVAVDVQLQEPGLFFRDTVIEGSFEVAEWAWTISPGPAGAARDMQSWFGTSLSRDGLDFYRWSTNTGSDALVADVARLDTLMDLDELASVLVSIDRRLLDLVVVVPLWQTSAGAGFDPVRLEGYRHPRFGVPITSNAAEWRVPGGCSDVPDGAVCGGVILPSAAG